MTIKGLRWWIVGLVAVGTVFNYLARSSLATAAPTLMDTLDISNQQYAWIVGAFQAAYTVMQPVAGYVLDLVGTRLGLFLFAFAWALSNMAHGFATGWMSLVFFRGLLGAAEASMIPAGLKVVSEWFPARERTVGTGWFNGGASIGAMLAPPIVAWCLLHYDWPLAFYVTGGASLLWAFAWLWLYRSPERHHRLGAQEKALILGERAQGGSGKVRWAEILRKRSLWGIAIPRALCDPAWHTFNFWIPLYLVTVRGTSLTEVAAFAWLPFLAADLGSIAGGYLAPFYMRRFGVSLVNSRRLVVASGAVLMAGPACIGLAHSTYAAVALFCVGGFAHQMLSGALLTLSSDLFEPREVATATGLAGSVSWAGAFVFSLVIGAVVDSVGYHPVFASLLVLDLLGTVAVWLIIRQPRTA